jgi:hypothetical protein
MNGARIGQVLSAGWPIVRFCILALGVGLAGCAAGGGVQYLPDPPLQADLSEPNYRKIVADNIGSVFPNAALGKLEISVARPVNHLRGPAWLTCLRMHADDTPQEYAIFILDDKIIDSRTGVAIDRCKQQAYEPFDPSMFTQRNSASTQQKKAGH